MTTESNDNNDALRSLDETAQANELYVLQDGKPVRCADPLTWRDWMTTTPRLLEATPLSQDRELCTLFAGYCGEVNGKQALTYCSVLKPNPQQPELALTLRWYETEAQARTGHMVLVERYGVSK